MKNARFWIVAIVGFALDQLTKFWTVQSFDQIGDTLPLWSGVFHLTYVQNPGAAFSFFSESGGWLRWLSLTVSVGLGIYALVVRLHPLEQVGFGCILAGAAGNGVDRFLFGYVVDFLDFRLIDFPVFNIADVAINIGIVLILLDTFQRSRPERTNNRKQTRQ
ncbi:lipoprotein signal peptidase [Rubidibacter lacunae KORDI 51-2]|uniref:Lipoprotein signal peptidase n=1 Tax=Rubidibacter lacunae KORDI 51-2 TaxID=582515 RepID=U5DR19_9CHRO|nr:signal peptidase II [Rubidibacter lacunae]ERN42120.1 lipoprotein signal peptidase [Rubidibacter lacunae KORDI 51-2]